MLYFQGRVPQNKIERILKGMGVELSDSEISRITLDPHPEAHLHTEQESIRRSALSKADFIQIDDTGAKILSEDGHTFVISNPYFCQYQTGLAKNRLSVVQALSGDRDLKYLINRTSLHLLKGRVGKKHIKFLGKWAKDGKLLTHTELQRRLRGIEHLPKPSREEIEIACAIAAYRFQKDGHGPSVLISDDATNFKGIFRHHQLCWVHEFRRYRVIPCFSEYHESLVNQQLKEMGQLYKRLKQYRIRASPEEKQAIESQFDQVFAQQKVPFAGLNEQRRFTMNRKEGLLLVLDFPHVPLHNNESELDLRERVLKRRISYGNRSWEGVKAWDLHMSLMATCRKLGVSYWEFLKDRLSHKNEIPSLHKIIQNAA